ncbi:One cut domain member 2 [Homalodisca vitripennis]|nr:One cut domain member 2 [Homalodisca vitripennis]
MGKMGPKSLTHVKGQAACKRKEEPQIHPEHTPAPKKPRLVFTDLQRRTLQAIFKATFVTIVEEKRNHQFEFFVPIMSLTRLRQERYMEEHMLGEEHIEGVYMWA